MAFERERRFGVIKIEKRSIKLFTSNTSYSTINIGAEVRDAKWIGEELLVMINDGIIRKYKTQTSYSIIK